ncbi:SH3 domain-containing protein [Dyella sp.]|uniref:SH3 domain-containing protein n=1 Tax=Dyella sp. TaxID=1869338 RepID=UPI002ED5AD0E
MKRVAGVLLAFLIAMPVLARAAEGVVVANVNLRAGPDTAYPRINTVPAGMRVDIQGCTEGYGWCDVIVGPDRGWIAAGYLQYTYQQQTVVVEDYGPRIGLPIVSFVIGTYWGNYYANRPFYRERNYWYHRPIAPRPPPRPPIHRPPPRPPIHRPPPRPQPGWGHRPPPRPPGGDHRPPPGRPNPGNGPRPNPGNGPRPNPGGGDHRPPPGGNRPGPGQGPGGNRPSPGQGGPQGGGRPSRPQPQSSGQ